MYVLCSKVQCYALSVQAIPSFLIDCLLMGFPAKVSPVAAWPIPAAPAAHPWPAILGGSRSIKLQATHEPILAALPVEIA